MPLRKQVFPVAVLRLVKGCKLSWKVIVLLKNKPDCVLEVHKILTGSNLKRVSLVRRGKVHQFDLSFESYADIVARQVAMSHFHVVKERIHSQKLLHILIEVSRISFEHSFLGFEGLGKVFHRNVVIG